MAFPWQKVVQAVGDTVGPVTKIIMGNKQKKMARNLKRSDGFDYIAPELKENQDLSEQGAYSNRSFNQGVDEANLRKATAGSRYSAGLTGSAAKKLSAGASSENKYINRLQLLRQKGRNERLGRVDKLMNANVMVGNVRAANEQRFQDTKAALKGASMQNIYGGISSWGDAISNSASMFGGKKGGGMKFKSPSSFKF